MSIDWSKYIHITKEKTIIKNYTTANCWIHKIL